jgi:hypothetical protein
MRGALLKNPEKRGRAHRRWFELAGKVSTDGKMRYFELTKAGPGGRQKGDIDLTGCTRIARSTTAGPWGISITVKMGRLYHLAADNAVDQVAWLEALGHHAPHQKLDSVMSSTANIERCHLADKASVWECERLYVDRGGWSKALQPQDWTHDVCPWDSDGLLNMTDDQAKDALTEARFKGGPPSLLSLSLCSSSFCSCFHLIPPVFLLSFYPIIL